MLARVVGLVSLLALLLFLVLSAQLGRLERSGPAQLPVAVDGDVPATLYLPQIDAGRAAFLDPLPRGERPPAVVLMHGFGSDRLGMSVLARRLAGSGYAVLTLDARGHGRNRRPFLRSRGRPDFFFQDLAAAVGFLRRSPLVDGSRVAVMGHSMGAGAVLDFATRDSGIDAAVMIAGGWTLQGPYTPPNALFLYAEGDPERIRSRVRRVAAQVAGVEELELGRTYGDPARGTGLRLVEAPGVDHMSIVWTAGPAAEIIAWLDGAFGLERADLAVPGDPRLGVVAAMFGLMLLVLPGLGAVVGRLAPSGSALPAEGRLQGLLALAVALLATMPLFSVGTPGAILSVEVGDVVVTHLGLVGVVLLVLMALVGADLSSAFAEWPRSLAAAAVALIGLYCLLFPLGVVLHRTTLTPERLLVFAVASAALLPFSLAFQMLLRRGRPLQASGLAILGRAVVLVTLVAGVRFEVLPSVVMLMLPPLAVVFLLFELLTSSIYAASRSPLAIALIDATLLALFVASGMPIRI